ncbi:prepilin peptidase [Sphingomonas arantia]|uniref:Prepilin leader peptidase/N-methyltransferase n=1 Tax=Sphingomonas arantia TaxID=1460676 RepID=A0ABW4TTN1_9SPHN
MIGSHLATIALRWPAGRSSATGRSQCDGCGRVLAAYELVPLLSWLILRGRCRRCGARIDWRHPAVEAVAGALAVAMAVALPPGAAIAGMGLAWTLLLLTVLDLDHYWLPDRLTLPLLAAGLLVGAAGIGPVLMDRIIGAAVGWGVLALVALVYVRVRGRVGLGGGDPKLFAAAGAWLGWRMLPVTLLIASAAGLALVLAAVLVRRKVAATTRVPFGPMIAFATIIGWIWIAR